MKNNQHHQYILSGNYKIAEIRNSESVYPRVLNTRSFLGKKSSQFNSFPGAYLAPCQTSWVEQWELVSSVDHHWIFSKVCSPRFHGRWFMCFFCFILLFFFAFFLSVFFHKHSQFTGQQGKGEAISLTILYHFVPIHRHLHISRAITAKSSHLYLASSPNIEPLVSEHKLLASNLCARYYWFLLFQGFLGIVVNWHIKLLKKTPFQRVSAHWRFKSSLYLNQVVNP